MIVLFYGGSMGIIENMLYEARPFIYGLIGIYSFFNFGNKILVVCGIVLLGCSTLVLSMRVNYRDRMQQAKAYNKSNTAIK